MKTFANPVFIVFVFLTISPVLAQHPLVGTWDMISVTGVGAEGDAFLHDTSTVKETKIITPTHYMLIAWDVEGDSLIFNRTMAGRVRLEGDQYIESPTQASVQLFDDVKVDFRWKLDGDIFTQSGTIVRPDGKSVVLEALKFKRITDTKADRKNPAIGTWKQLSGHYETSDGTKQTTFDPSHKRLLIVTPTHWMRMDHENNKFSGALYGTYSRNGKSIKTRIEYSSYPADQQGALEFEQRVQGNRIELIYQSRNPGGQTATYHDIYEKE